MSRLFHQDGHIRLYQGDSRSMAELPDGSVQCVVTSPPYWGLRDYRLELLVWDGRDGCGHEWAALEGT